MKLLVFPSELMDKNNKPSRNEGGLIRLPKATRKTLPYSATIRYLDIELSVYKAYKEDIKRINKLILKGVLPENAKSKTGFVTTKNFNIINTDGFADFVEIEVDEINDFRFMLGGDPEFLLMEGSKIIHANELYDINHSGPLGSDGAMAEIRPLPAKSPEDLVTNIYNVFTDSNLPESILKLDWIAECYYETSQRDYPVGTHIHFDNPNYFKKLLTSTTKMRLYAVTNKILDELLTIPMIRLDGSKGHKRRARCKMSSANGFNTGNYGKGYGFFGEWRCSNGRLEYRSLSGLVLSSPTICRDVLGTAKAIVEAVYNRVIEESADKEFILPSKFNHKLIYDASFSEWGDIPLASDFGCTLSSDKMITLTNNSSRQDITPEYVRKWLRRMRKLSTYSKYELYVESLGDLLSCKAVTLENLDHNIKKNWSI